MIIITYLQVEHDALVVVFQTKDIPILNFLTKFIFSFLRTINNEIH